MDTGSHPPHTTNQADDKIGRRIKRFRENQEISLEELAGRTGLSEDFLASVEEDSQYPSLGPLLKISRALGVRLGTFLDDQVSRDPLVVRLSERREELTTHVGDDPRAAVTFHSLGRGKIDRHMEPFFVELGPESDAVGDDGLSSHEGEEFIVCVKGRVSIRYAREETILEPGDSAYFNSVVPHHVSCASDTPAEIYAVLYFPE